VNDVTALPLALFERDEASRLRGLLALSMLMVDRVDAHEIIALLAAAVQSVAGCELVEVLELDSVWRPAPGSAATRFPLADEIAGLGALGGPISAGPRSWGYALPLRSFGAVFAYAVVSAEREPPPDDQLRLRLLVEQTGIALANARLHVRERDATADLATTNLALAEALAAIEQTIAIHNRLTAVAAAGGDQAAIARALYDLTSYPVVIEDRYGNLRAWAGDRPPEPYDKSSPRVRAAMLRRARQAGRPIREGDRLLTLASLQDDLLAVLAIVDPAGTAGEREQIALEHGGTVLAMELARLRAVAETELRLGRDLVDALLADADEEQTLARAQGLGYDLLRTHRVVIIESFDDPERDQLFHAVRRAARDLALGTLLVARGNQIVLIADAEGDWERVRHDVDGASRGRHCRIGVGGACGRPSEFRRSNREALLALKVQTALGAAAQATEFDGLGVFRILAESEELSVVERFIDHWLGALREYDEAHASALVETLSRYLENGGSHRGAALALSMHRNTLKYRLQRIHEISGFDLADADSRFNLQLATRAFHTLQALGA
jgi:DNA-binding PucR family transcriptional regulator